MGVEPALTNSRRAAEVIIRSFKDNDFSAGKLSEYKRSWDLENKKVKWTYEDLEEGDAFFACPAVLENRLVIGSRDERVHCLNRLTGKRIWTFRTQGEVDSSPVIAGNKIVFGSADGRLYMVKLSNGAKIWSYEIGAGIYVSPAVAAGMVIIGAEDGNVYAFASE